MSPADLPLSLEAGSVIRELGAGEVLFEQGDRAAAIYKVETRSASASQTHGRRSSCDPPYRVSTRVLRGSLSFRSNLPLRCSRGRTLANSGLPEGEGDGGAPNRPGTRTSVHGPPRQSASGTSGKDGVAQHPLGRERVLQYLRLRADLDRRSIAIDGQLQDIAAEIGITREALYRTLAPLEAEGSIAREGSAIALKKPEVP